MSNADRKHNSQGQKETVYFFYNLKSTFRINLIVKSAVCNMRMCSAWAFLYHIACSVCPISDTDTENVHIRMYTWGLVMYNVKQQHMKTQD